MSQENVEIATRHFGTIVRVLTTYWKNPRSVSAAAESGQLDPDRRDVFDRLHPDVRWTNVIGEVYEGKLGCATGVDELLRASQDYAVRLDEVTDLDHDHVLVVVRSEGKGQSSGAAGAVTLFTLVTMRNGLIAQVDEYLSRAEALKAVGLEQ
jgi:ketosteroid isomerase-like protein